MYVWFKENKFSQEINTGHNDLWTSTSIGYIIKQTKVSLFFLGSLITSTREQQILGFTDYKGNILLIRMSQS